MKHLTIILSILLLSSCYTRKAAIRKFCTPSTFDTVVVVSDTLVIDSTRIDTVFSHSVDSIYIERGKLSIVYKRIHDSVYLSGKYEADTIIRTDTIRISTPITIPNGKLSTWEFIVLYWKWLLGFFTLGFLVCLYRK